MIEPIDLVPPMLLHNDEDNAAVKRLHASSERCE